MLMQQQAISVAQQTLPGDYMYSIPVKKRPRIYVGHLQIS